MGDFDVVPGTPITVSGASDSQQMHAKTDSLTAAGSRGRIGGQPQTLTPDKLVIAQQMHASHKHTN
jgi:hypothetical protein